jgi:hypothetical protein
MEHVPHWSVSAVETVRCVAGAVKYARPGYTPPGFVALTQHEHRSIATRGTSGFAAQSSLSLPMGSLT